MEKDKTTNVKLPRKMYDKKLNKDIWIVEVRRGQLIDQHVFETKKEATDFYHVASKAVSIKED